MKEENISVAAMYLGNRADKVLKPLETTDMQVDIEPSNPYDYDIVLLDNPDRNLGFEVLKKPLHNAKLVYRLRGDVFHELDGWPMHPVKKWVAKEIVLNGVDAAIGVAPHMSQVFREKTHVPYVGTARLGIDTADWPTVKHTDRIIRALTLTNPDYREKIYPILEWADTVNEFCNENGGNWIIGGEGMHENILRDGLKEYERVHFKGYIDARKWIARSNVLLHPSRLDALPNAVLEGMASNLPVITNDFVAFTDYNGPITIVENTHKLTQTLTRYQNPLLRKDKGKANREYIENKHSYEEIGQEFVTFFKKVLA